MDRLGLSIFSLPILIGGTKGLVPLRIGVVILGGILTVFLSCVIFPLAFFQFTTEGSLRIPVEMCVLPVTISLWRTSHTACKTLPLVVTLYVVLLLTSRMTPWMITGISHFVNNLCGWFPLVVSVSVIFPFFLSLVWVSTNGSLFGSLLVTLFLNNHLQNRWLLIEG